MRHAAGAHAWFLSAAHNIQPHLRRNPLQPPAVCGTVLFTCAIVERCSAAARAARRTYSFASKFAPRCSSSVATTAWPRCTASCSGVLSNCAQHARRSIVRRRKNQRATVRRRAQHNEAERATATNCRTHGFVVAAAEAQMAATATATAACRRVLLSARQLCAAARARALRTMSFASLFAPRSSSSVTTGA